MHFIFLFRKILQKPEVWLPSYKGRELAPLIFKDLLGDARRTDLAKTNWWLIVHANLNYFSAKDR
jgi:hypothetical protein